MEEEWTQVGARGEEAVCGELWERLCAATGAPREGLAGALGACCAVPSTTCGHQFVRGDRVFVCHTCTRTCNAVWCEACFAPARHAGHVWDVHTTVEPGGTCDCGDPQQLHPAAFCPRHARTTTPQTPPAPFTAAVHNILVAPIAAATTLAERAAAANRATCDAIASGTGADTMGVCENESETALRAIAGGVAAFCTANSAAGLLGEALAAQTETLVGRLLCALDMLRHATRQRLHALLCACFTCAAFKCAFARVYVRTMAHTGPLFEIELRAARLQDLRLRTQRFRTDSGINEVDDELAAECAAEEAALMAVTDMSDQTDACFDALAPHVLWTPDVAAMLAEDPALDAAATLLRTAHARLQPVLLAAAPDEVTEDNAEEIIAGEDRLVDGRGARLVFYAECFLHSERDALLASLWRTSAGADALCAFCAAAEGCDAHVRRTAGAAADLALGRTSAVTLPLVLLDRLARQIAHSTPVQCAPAFAAQLARALRKWATAHHAQCTGSAVSLHHPLAHTLVELLCELARRSGKDDEESAAAAFRAASAAVLEVAEEEGPAEPLWAALVDVPARLLCFAAEVDAGRWVRNSIEFGWYAQVYRLGARAPVCADVAALQLACALTSPCEVVDRIFHVFGADDYDEPQQGQEQEEEEEQEQNERLGWVLQTVVAVAWDRECVAQSTEEERLRDAVVQLLAGGARSYSELAEALGLEPFEQAAHAALEAALASTATFAPPTPTVASGTYALRPALWREYDACWPRRSAAAREAADERCSSATATAAASNTPRAQPRVVVPALAAVTRVLAEPRVVQAVARVLECASPPGALLARALDVVERALVLGVGAPYSTLLPRIAALGGTRSIEAAVARIARLSSSSSSSPSPASSLPSAEFRARAHGQQARAMALLRAQQSRVLHHLEDNNSSNSSRVEEGKDEEKKEKKEEDYGMCMLCHEPVCFSECASECLARPAGFAAHVVASRVLAVVHRQSEEQWGPLSFSFTPKIGDKDEEEGSDESDKESDEEISDNEDNEEERETGWRTGVIQTCGHVMHCDCYAAHLERLGLAPAAGAAYRCPLCGRHCNTLVPVVPRARCHLPAPAVRALTWLAHAVIVQLCCDPASEYAAGQQSGWLTRTAFAGLCAHLRAVLCASLAEGEHVLRETGTSLRAATPRFWRACADALWQLHLFTAPQRASCEEDAPEVAREPFAGAVHAFLAAPDPCVAVFTTAAQHALNLALTQAHLVHAVRMAASDVSAAVSTPFFASAGPDAVAAVSEIVHLASCAAGDEGQTKQQPRDFNPEECTIALLRRLLVAQRTLFGGSLAAARVPCDRDSLLDALHLKMPTTCACVPALVAAVTAAKMSPSIQHLNVACDPPGLPQLHFVDLPDDYVELVARFPAHYHCWRDVARGAALCLVCGTLFPGGVHSRRVLARHPARCAGTCPALFLQHAAVVVATPGGHGGPWAALCYLGPHGEDDVGLRKGLRLTLDRARLDEIRRALVAHAFDGKFPPLSFHLP